MKRGIHWMIHLLQKLDALASPPCCGSWMIVRLLPTGRSQGRSWGFPWPWGYPKMDGSKGKSFSNG